MVGKTEINQLSSPPPLARCLDLPGLSTSTLATSFIVNYYTNQFTVYI